MSANQSPKVSSWIGNHQKDQIVNRSLAAEKQKVAPVNRESIAIFLFGRQKGKSCLRADGQSRGSAISRELILCVCCSLKMFRLPCITE